ncbi:SDR family oxidoreductase [Brevibacterium marinum]|uniref:NAD(P)-dependent dehydrogenase (Short-subunit alcohol dehydrogenase family) n=1 Tax=Brevibacterium marinum TaxID=418643 RepID=A0A846RTA3_9MICO|nr:SDR family oxidoreductase [Brevibacterium marinum]NJC57009.1 NAD(P)-dependent dehydrogenase (short-subunit alcohol dehydrogenase family) [Brevibacterium marinum]
MSSLFDLKGKTGLITGAGQGIGHAVALAWARAGANVAVLDANAENAARTADELDSIGVRSLAIAVDVSDEIAVHEAVQQVDSELGDLDIAFNNAGIARGEVPSVDMPAEWWRSVIDVNLSGVFYSAQAEARVMLPRGRGAVLNMASMSGIIANRGLLQPNYNASKAGVAHLTRSLAVEWGLQGVRVNSLSPGYILTPLTERDEVADKRAEWISGIPLGRMGTVDDLTGPATFAVSDSSAYMNGHDLVVDGGFVCW